LGTEPLKLVVGFYNFRDLEVLREAISAHNKRVETAGLAGGRQFFIYAANQDAQRVFDDAVKGNVDAVALSPDISGYRHALIRDLLLNPKKPIPTVGLISPRSDDGRIMESNGAKGFVAVPLDETGAVHCLSLIAAGVDAALQERLEGRLRLGSAALPTGSQSAFRQKMITVYVPKGGGSTRTTVATNLAVALAHAELGNVSTGLVDLDMAKGDCHTLLGMTSDDDTALSYGWPLLRRGLYDLIVNAAAAWPQQGENAVNQVMINNFIAHWAGADSQLDLLPGLTNPHQGAKPEFANWDLLYKIARRILQEARRKYVFVVADIGQDYNLPLHRAAIDESDEVLVTVPPNRTAIVDTVHALPALENQFGGLDKFKLVITAFEPSFGISESEMVDAIRLPKVATIPFDALVANQAVNTATPFVLTDRDGPLGSAIIALAGMYYPELARASRQRKGKVRERFSRMLFRDA